MITNVNKGFPLAAMGQSIEKFLATKPNLFSSGFQFPIAVLRKSAIEHNLKRMQQYCYDEKVLLAPHAKTTMSPQLAQMQMDHGAWALTVANFSQARIFLDFGFKRFIIANEVVDPDSIRTIAAINAKPEHEILFYVESLAGVEIIKKALAGVSDVSVHLLIEIGMAKGRAGVRENDQVVAIAEAISQDPKLILRGVAGFEGSVPGDSREREGIAALSAFCQKIVDAATKIKSYVEDGPIIISAGGSAYFDIVSRELNKFGTDSLVILRSGCYIAHDHGFYSRRYPFVGATPDEVFLPAIELWSQVLAQPEVGLAILNTGKRDVGIDLDQPLPIKRYSGEILSMKGKIDHLNDQHAFMHVDSTQEIIVGDLVALGISHPCTTLDKWRLIPMIDDDYQVVDCIHTYF